MLAKIPVDVQAKRKKKEKVGQTKVARMGRG
jgi:hypothetical protein